MPNHEFNPDSSERFTDADLDYYAANPLELSGLSGDDRAEIARIAQQESIEAQKDLLDTLTGGKIVKLATSGLRKVVRGNRENN